MSDTPIPEEFTTALLSLRDTPRSPELVLQEIPPPRQLAPWSAGLSLHTRKEGHQNPLATGRFVVLYDPDGQIGWNGSFRIVAQLRTQIDAEMSTDPLLCEALWNWAHDCLDDAGAGYHDLTGTVTKEMSESFGGLQLTDSALYVELRASWTPSTPYLGEHLSAWMELVCRTSGVTPTRHLEHI
ncbi:DUF3000 domain-containing protein [Schaalia canis]|uniref:DUF3000 domain-containing protein n=1 Tax=Schaalia canis TaxID=100469 RepID=A0A3P1SHN9_9ACTO|nr:DUF3000 domain-containing protein [Schaalia canis]RRC96285.1 DUF3000 domain-containing protein [Schaalia canis]